MPLCLRKHQIGVNRAPPPERIPPRPLAPSRPDDHEPATSVTGQYGVRRFLPSRAHYSSSASTFAGSSGKGPDLSRRNAIWRARFMIYQKMSSDPMPRRSWRFCPDAEFASLFGPDSRSEVPITGTLGSHIVAGQVDRLIVEAARVQIIDYKSNRPPPGDAADVSPGLFTSDGGLSGCSKIGLSGTGESIALCSGRMPRIL